MSNNYGNYGGGYPPPPGDPNQGQGGYPPPASGGGYGGYPPPAGGTGPYGQPGYPPQQPGYQPQQPGYPQPGGYPQPQYGGYPGGPSPTPPKKSNATPLILGGVGLLAVIVVVVVAVLVLGGNKNSTPEAAVSPTAGANLPAASPSAAATTAASTTVASLATATPVKAATTVAASTTAAATTRAATTAAATTRAATAAAATTSGTSTTGTLPLYPGAKSVQLPASVTSSFAGSVGSTAKNPKVSAYVVPGDSDTIKTFYQTELVKAGWSDYSSAFGSQLDQISQLGGWAIGYTKVPNIVVVMLLPGSLATGLSVDAGPDDQLLLVFTANV